MMLKVLSIGFIAFAVVFALTFIGGSMQQYEEKSLADDFAKGLGSVVLIVLVFAAIIFLPGLILGKK